MHTLTRIGGLSLLTLLWCHAPVGTQEPKQGGAITLEVVNYDKLCDVITKHRGKVVLVDFFTDNCIPCRQAFPHIVEMHRKYADKGLVTVSVSLDPWTEEGYKEEMRETVLKYLQKKDAKFTNLMLNERLKFIGERLRIETVPCLYVFDRQGRWMQFDGKRLGEKKTLFEEGKYYKYTEVEEVVQKLLAK